MFIASNWPIMSAFAEIGFIFTAIVGSYYLGWCFRFEPGNRPELGSVMLVLGAVFYGAGIGLISQMYHLPTTMVCGLILWLLGVFPIFLVLKMRSSGLQPVVRSGDETAISRTKFANSASSLHAPRSENANNAIAYTSDFLVEIAEYAVLTDRSPALSADGCETISSSPHRNHRRNFIISIFAQLLLLTCLASFHTFIG